MCGFSASYLVVARTFGPRGVVANAVDQCPVKTAMMNIRNRSPDNNKGLSTDYTDFHRFNKQATRQQHIIWE
jgi:hypothetical protein